MTIPDNLPKAPNESTDIELLPQFDEGDSSDDEQCHFLDLVREGHAGPNIAHCCGWVTHVSLVSSATNVAEVGIRIYARDRYIPVPGHQPQYEDLIKIDKN